MLDGDLVFLGPEVGGDTHVLEVKVTYAPYDVFLYYIDIELWFLP